MMSVVKVIMCERRPEDKHPRYVTICRKEHWGKEGVMITSGTWDATKFSSRDKDVHILTSYLNKTREDNFVIKSIDEYHLNLIRNEYWSDEQVNCGFKKDGIFEGNKLI